MRFSNLIVPVNFFNLEDWLDEIVKDFEAPLLSIQVQVNKVPVQLRIHRVPVAAHRVVIVAAPLVLRVRVLLVNQRLEVHYLDVVPSTVRARNHGVHLRRVVFVAGQQLLDRRVVQQILLRQAQNLEGLLLGHEATLDS